MLRAFKMLSFSDKYGFLVVLITIIVRILVISLAWNYGIFVLALKKAFPNSKLLELEWIAGLAQGLGSLIAPLYLIIIKKIGIRISFTIALGLCSLSLFASSFVQNEHLLFLSYSLPFGIGSSFSIVIGTLISGLYFPSQNKFHMLATVSVSLGFPLGYLVLNPLTEYLFENHDWHFVKRLYSLVAFTCLILFAPFFTDKHINTEVTNDENIELITGTNEKMYPSRKFQIITNIFWFSGLFSLGLAINAIVINLNGYFESINIKPVDAAHIMMVLGGADAFYRLMLSLSGYFFSNLLVVFYIVAGNFGVVLTVAWHYVTHYGLNYLMTVAFALCSAVFMSLQYPAGAEINGVSNIQNTYTLSVVVSGLGVITGPTISGALLDASNRDYKAVFKLSMICFMLSMVLFSITKICLFYAKKANKKADMSINES